MPIALGLTGSRKARVSGLLKKELTIFDTCCNPSLEDMVLAAENTTTRSRASVRHAQHARCSGEQKPSGCRLQIGAPWTRQNDRVPSAFLPPCFPCVYDARTHSRWRRKKDGVCWAGCVAKAPDADELLQETLPRVWHCIGHFCGLLRTRRDHQVYNRYVR